jgi:hypothetical protein
MRVPAILIAIPTAILTIATTAALAQQGQAAPAASQPSIQSAPWQAPIGHRQPRLSDLPPDLARAQRSGELSKSDATQSSEPPSAPATNGAAGSNTTGKLIDERLRICRGC